mgnify:CR=1 FL=1
MEWDKVVVQTVLHVMYNIFVSLMCAYPGALNLNLKSKRIENLNRNFARKIRLRLQTQRNQSFRFLIFFFIIIAISWEIMIRNFPLTFSITTSNHCSSNKSKYFDGIVSSIFYCMNNKFLIPWGHSRVVIT